jgi:hypothetical protein
MEEKPNCTRYGNVRHHGQALIGLLVVVGILLALYLMFLGPRRGEDGEVRPSVAKQSIDRSKDVAGSSNISQIQMAIDMYKNDNEGRPPGSLDELKKSAYAKGFPPEMWVDPVTQQPLVYDPVAGRILPPSGSSVRVPGSAAPAAPNAPAPGPAAPGGIQIPDMQPKMPADFSGP